MSKEPFIEGIEDKVERFGFQFEAMHYGAPDNLLIPTRRYWGYDRYIRQPSIEKAVSLTLDIAAISQGGLDIILGGILFNDLIAEGTPQGMSLIQKSPYKDIEEVAKAISQYSNLEGFKRFWLV